MGRRPGQRFTEAERAEIIASVISDVATGIPVGKSVRGKCNEETFWRWHGQDPAMQVTLARARIAGVERDMEEIKMIADNPKLDPAHKRAMIYARELRARMLAPRKYGPKLDLTSDNERIGGQMDDTQIAIRAASLVAAAMKRSGRVVEAIDDMSEEDGDDD
jgi:hypothetical protein